MNETIQIKIANKIFKKDPFYCKHFNCNKIGMVKLNNIYSLFFNLKVKFKDSRNIKTNANLNRQYEESKDLNRFFKSKYRDIIKNGFLYREIQDCTTNNNGDIYYTADLSILEPKTEKLLFNQYKIYDGNNNKKLDYIANAYTFFTKDDDRANNHTDINFSSRTGKINRYCSWKNDSVVGKEYKFYDNGKIKSIIEYNNPKNISDCQRSNGITKFYNKKKRLTEEYHTKNGIKNGKYLSYWENGSLKEYGKYIKSTKKYLIDGIKKYISYKDGDWHLHKQSGGRFITITYKKDKVISRCN